MLIANIQCLGFRVDDLHVPPFSARPGEFICLHAPPDAGQSIFNVPRRLSGEARNAAVSIRGKVLRVDPPLMRTGFLWRQINPTIGRWLQTRGGLSRESAQELLDRYTISAQERVGTLQWTPRALLGLEAALLRKPDILIFDNHGLALDGVELSYLAIESHLERMATIFIAYGSTPPRPCHPRAVCMSIQHLESASRVPERAA